MAEELISSYIDKAAIEKETQFLVGQLEKVYILFGKIKNIKIELEGSKSFAQVADGIKRVKKEEDDLLKLQSQIDAAYRRRQLLETEQAKILAEEKLLLQNRNQELKNSIREQNAAEGSLEQLRASLIRLNKEYDNLSKAEREAGKGTELLKNIENVSNELKKLEGETGRFQRNVGNYAGSLSPALETVKNELEQVRAQLKQTGLSANEIDKLNKNAALLEKVLAGVDVATKSTKQELRSFTEAAKQIGVEFGISSKQFQKFIKEVGSKKDELKDIEAAINFQASDTKYLDGIIEGVNGVAGAFSAAEGATALFGDAGKDLQETMVRLQALIAITTGLQQVLNSIQTESAASQTILAARTNLLSVSESINAKIKSFLAGSTQAVVVSQTEQAIATEVTVAALESEVIAGEAAAITNVEIASTAGAAGAAMLGEATATEVATSATYSFATSLTATGIGAIVIGIAAAIVYLVSKVSDYNAANESMIEANNDLQKSLSDAVSALQEYDNIRNISFKQQIDQAQALADTKKAAGVNAQQSLALDIAVEQKKQAHAKNEIDRQKTAIENIDKFLSKTKESAAYVLHLENQRNQLNEQTSNKGDSDYKDKLEKLNKNIEIAKNEAKADKDQYDYLLNLKQSYTDSTNKLDILNANSAKQNADDIRKVILEMTKFESELIIDKNNRILSNEQSTQQQRLAAIRSNAKELKSIAIAENNAIQNDPTQSEASKKIAAQNLSNTLIKINRDEKEQNKKINEDYYKRKLAVELSANKIATDAIITYNQKILESDIFSYDVRLEAFQKYQEAKKSQIDAEYNNQKKLNAINGSTKEEQELLEKDHQAKLTALIAEGTAKQIDIQLSAMQKITSELESNLQKREQLSASINAQQIANISRNYSSEVLALNDKLQKGQISITAYNEKRKKIDDDFSKNSLKNTQDYLKQQLKDLQAANDKALADKQKYQDELNKLQEKSLTTLLTPDELIEADRLQKKIDSYKDYTDKIKGLEKELFDTKVGYSDKDVDLKKQAEEKKKAVIQQIQSELVDLFKTIIDATYQNELNAIQDNIDALENKKAKDIEVVNQTTQSEQEKADKIKIIEAKAQSDKEQLEQRKRKIQLEQARFEKAFNIAKIIADTASGIMQNIKLYGAIAATPLNIATGILGAVQLAKVIATPLPKYASGTDDHIGGYAMVGDGGRQEVIVDPSGKTYLTPKTPTIVDMPAHSIVYPSVEDFTKAALLFATPNIPKFDGQTASNIELISEVSRLRNEMQDVKNAIKNKRETHFSVTRWGMISQQEQDNNLLTYLNDYIKF